MPLKPFEGFGYIEAPSLGQGKCPEGRGGRSSLADDCYCKELAKGAPPSFSSMYGYLSIQKEYWEEAAKATQSGLQEQNDLSGFECHRLS